jgi:hypothetical protein
MAPTYSAFVVLHIESERALRYIYGEAMLTNGYSGKLVLKHGGYTAASA